MASSNPYPKDDKAVPQPLNPKILVFKNPGEVIQWPSAAAAKEQIASCLFGLKVMGFRVLGLGLT